MSKNNGGKLNSNAKSEEKDSVVVVASLAQAGKVFKAKVSSFLATFRDSQNVAVSADCEQTSKSIAFKMDKQGRTGYVAAFKGESHPLTKGEIVLRFQGRSVAESDKLGRIVASAAKSEHPEWTVNKSSVGNAIKINVDLKTIKVHEDSALEAIAFEG